MFEECENTEDYQRNLIENIALLYECDTFNVFTDLLNFEIK